MFDLESAQLENDFVRLEPLTFWFVEELWEVASEKGLWEWTPNCINSLDEMREYVISALTDATKKRAMPFVIFDKRQRKVAGCTRFANFDKDNWRAEIGWTFIGSRFQNTYINTSSKLLMLKLAFEKWKCMRVELKTDVLNERSRRAISSIGGVEEGILRKHMITHSGRFRDTVIYSILDTEWESVKNKLEDKLNNFK